MTVRGLLDRPRLQLTLVGGSSGLDREIIWAHASDLPDPWDWLGPSELLLTNGTGISAQPAAQVHFAERLARTDASGLVIGLGTGGPPVSPELAERSCELDLPLLTVPYSVRFSDIVRTVARGGDPDQADSLGEVAQFYDLLRLALAAGDLGPATFDALGRQLGLRLHLVDAETGTSVFEDETFVPLGQALARSVAEHGHAIPGLLRLTRDGRGDGDVCALAVAVPGEPMTALVVEPLGTRLPSVAMLQHVAIAGAVQLAQIVSQRERTRRDGGELLEQLLEARPARRPRPPDPSPGGLDLAAAVLAVLRPGTAVAEDVLHRACSRAHLPSLLVRRDDLLHIAAPETAMTGLLLPLLAGLGCRAGLSDVVGSAARMPDAAQEASWALGIAEADQVPMVRYGNNAGLLLPRTPAEADLLADRILGTLVAYDRMHATQYVATVRALVRADGSWQRAAAELHVHKQTLGYRLRKIEELTGRGFSRIQHLAEWWCALQALDLLTGCRPDLTRRGRRLPGQEWRALGLAARTPCCAPCSCAE